MFNHNRIGVLKTAKFFYLAMFYVFFDKIQTKNVASFVIFLCQVEYDRVWFVAVIGRKKNVNNSISCVLIELFTSIWFRHLHLPIEWWNSRNSTTDLLNVVESRTDSIHDGLVGFAISFLILSAYIQKASAVF